MAMIEQRDLIRWFKMGWVLAIATIIITFITSSMGLTSFHGLMDQFAANPTGVIGALAGLLLISLLWVLLVYPIILGWLIEFVGKKIRK